MEIPVNKNVVKVDVRNVEPRFRFDTIMGAFRALGVGEEMDLYVDHDPTCMYYTLKAEYGDDSFAFEYLERGPETWRVLVGKRAERNAA